MTPPAIASGGSEPVQDNLPTETNHPKSRHTAAVNKTTDAAPHALPVWIGPRFAGSAGASLIAVTSA
jgi:hypothetical protein